MIGLAAMTGGALLAGAAGVFCRATFFPRSQLWGRVIFHGLRAAPPRIALTFDDGPHPAATPRILDILRDQGAPATFFVIGRHAQAAPDLVRRCAAEGHLVANHSFHHAHLGTLRLTRYWIEEIQRTDDLIEALTGQRSTIFRPPMGFKTWRVLKAARTKNHVVVTWTRRAFDGLRTSPQRICWRLQDSVQAGDIISLHDGVDPPFQRDLEATMAALPLLIDRWRERGFTLVRLDELINHPLEE